MRDDRTFRERDSPKMRSIFLLQKTSFTKQVSTHLVTRQHGVYESRHPTTSTSSALLKYLFYPHLSSTPNPPVSPRYFGVTRVGPPLSHPQSTLLWVPTTRCTSQRTQLHRRTSVVNEPFTGDKRSRFMGDSGPSRSRGR